MIAFFGQKSLIGVEDSYGGGLRGTALGNLLPKKLHNLAENGTTGTVLL